MSTKTAAAHLTIDGHDIALSNPDKVLYPQDGYSKHDVVDYFRSVAATMLPHTRGRPMTLRRYPDGIDSEGFFQKEASRHFPEWIRVEAVPQRSSSTPVHHVICDDAATLAYLAGQACLEFHVALSTTADLERPVVVVIDLDPPSNTSLAVLREVAGAMCDRFADNGLEPYVQATGGRGFHVVAPLTGDTEFDAVRAFARDIADSAMRDDPDRLTTEQRKAQRGERIFLDTNRNAYGQTMIAPYSLRARRGAPAATPLRLSELRRADPRDHGLANMTRRIQRHGDPWAALGR